MSRVRAEGAVGEDGGGGGVSSHQATSAVRGEKVQSGSNDNAKKENSHTEGRDAFMKITIGQQWRRPCVAPQFSGTKSSFLKAVKHYLNGITLL